jgi:hypothetical protein
MFLFAEELLALDDIRSELDGAVELEAICALTNRFLGCSPPRLSHADVCDEALRHALVRAPTRLRSEISERLAHVEEGPQRTVASLAEDVAPAVAIPVLRYSPLLRTPELVAMAKRWTADPAFESHLEALAARRRLGPELTILLAARGTPAVMRVLAANPAAQWWWHAKTKLALGPPRAGLTAPSQRGHARGLTAVGST